MQEELLRLCGYGKNAQALQRAEQVRKNYSHFDEIVTALKDLEPLLQHSNFYLSLQSDFDLIHIRNDMLDGDEFMMLDSDIIVWANEHNIDLEEGFGYISILGFKNSE